MDVEAEITELKRRITVLENEVRADHEFSVKVFVYVREMRDDVALLRSHAVVADKRIERLEERVERIEASLGALRMDLNELRSEFNELRSEFAASPLRVQCLPQGNARPDRGYHARGASRVPQPLSAIERPTEPPSPQPAVPPEQSACRVPASLPHESADRRAYPG
jgi:hypothetical protein